MTDSTHVTARATSRSCLCLISFSGIDGSGKTTQIDALVTWLNGAGLNVRVIRFWDDIAVLVTLREGASHAIFKSEKGVGSPDRPVQRRDKNVRGWYMSAIRLLLYFLDALHLLWVAAAVLESAADVVIFDRYIYDELINLEQKNWAVRVYTKVLLKLTPQPDISFLLDADPLQARARKPEYPLEFLQAIRANYKTLCNSSRSMTVIGPLSAEEVTRIVLQEVGSAVLRTQAEKLSCGAPLASR